MTSSPRIVRSTVSATSRTSIPSESDVVGEARGAVGPAARSRAAAARSVWSSRPSISACEPLGPWRRGELLQRAVADVARGDLRREVAEQLVRDADVRAEDVEQRLVPARRGRTSRIHGRRRPSWKTSVVSHAHEPGHAAADVAVVRDGDREAEQSLAGERRLRDEDVGRVARAVERVVDDEDVARREAVAVAARAASASRSGSSRAGAGSSPPARPSPRTGRRARPRSPSRRGRPPSARCGRSAVAISSASGLERVADETHRDRAVVTACAGGHARRGRGRARRVAAVEAHGPARRDDDRRVVLVDEQRAVGRLGEVVRASDTRVRDRAVAEVRAARPASGRGRPRGSAAARARGRARRRAARGCRSASRARAACRRAARARPRSARRASASDPASISPGSSIGTLQLWPR